MISWGSLSKKGVPTINISYISYSVISLSVSLLSLHPQNTTRYIHRRAHPQVTATTHGFCFGSAWLPCTPIFLPNPATASAAPRPQHCRQNELTFARRSSLPPRPSSAAARRPSAPCEAARCGASVRAASPPPRSACGSFQHEMKKRQQKTKNDR